MEDIDSNYHVAGLLAYHLVNLVLQEGCMIANAALESGRPREYLLTRAIVRSDLTYVIRGGEDTVYVDTTDDNFIEGAANAKAEPEQLLVTSTPQKMADEKLKSENGQGDEYKDNTVLEQNDLSNSTSLFINHLFDISDVELGITGDATSLENDARSELLAPLITNVMDFYVNAALDAFHATKNKSDESPDKRVRISGNSSFSYIEDVSDDRKDVVFYIDDEAPCCTDNIYEIPQDPMTSQMALQQSGVTKVRHENFELYENTYLSLNRDYEQCSDEDEYPILEDPKGMLMQEIVLLTANTSNDTARSYDEAEVGLCIDRNQQKGCLAATSGVSARSRKSRLVQRWRLQGARVLACIRGWWRRKAPGKHKVSSGSAGSRVRRPLSPGARARAASLLVLEQRVSAPPTCPAKCNTINEALINSLHWKDYSFETRPNDCGDV